MAYQQNPGSGTLFKNKKEKSSQPDYRGPLILDRDLKAGDKIELAAWVKEPKSGGDKFLSLSISRPREDKPQQTHAAASVRDDLDDDLPPF